MDDAVERYYESAAADTESHLIESPIPLSVVFPHDQNPEIRTKNKINKHLKSCLLLKFDIILLFLLTWSIIYQIDN